MMRLLLRLVFILLCYLFLQANYQEVRTSITRTETHRSSVLRTIYDYALLTNAFSVQTIAGFFACAQSCLGDSRCMSVNFHRVPSLCEMSTDYIDGQMKECTCLYYSEGSVFGQLVNVSNPGLRPEMEKPDCKDCVFVFRTLGAKGRSGPMDTHSYNKTSLEGSVTLDKGKQLWRVPQTAEYSIAAYGASGANGTCKNDSEVCHSGGLGARIIGSFHLIKDTMLTILVGQQGQLDSNFELVGGGGGGGSFVVNTEKQLPLVVAGGGGGGGEPSKGLQDGDPGQQMENGSRCGGFDGKGGKFCNSSGAEITDLFAGSGAGFYGDGVHSPGIFHDAQSFSKGGLGGKVLSFESVGGFGGGGFGMKQGGGGGGYSGGGIIGGPKEGTAGGGGSYNSGSSQENEAGINYGDGRVIITVL